MSAPTFSSGNPAPRQSREQVPSGPRGAHKSDWDHFDVMGLGLGADILPCVQADAVPAPGTKIETFGKVPSFYVSPDSNQALGIRAWQKKVLDGSEIKKWSKDPRHGICIRTRAVRAIDVDVTDSELALQIRLFLGEYFLGPLPTRTRANAPKFLCAFTCHEPIQKRIINTKAGRIELLGDGQQFVAAGMHPSGVSYEWDDGLPTEIPTFTLEAINLCWQKLAEKFGVADVAKTNSPLSGGLNGTFEQQTTATPEQLADIKSALAHPALREAAADRDVWAKIGLALISIGADGRALWEEYSRGAAGYDAAAEGWWDANASQTTRSDFRTIFKMASEHGWQNTGSQSGPASAEDFEDQDTAGTPAPGGQLVTRGNGQIIPNVQNAATFTRSFLHGRLHYDEFMDRMLIHWPDEQRRLWQDADAVRLQISMQARGMSTMSKQAATDAAELVSRMSPANCVQEYLLGLKWDGVKRLSTWLHHAFGAPTDKYHLRAGRNFLIAMCARAMQPGCQVDEVLVLEGEQGIKKTAALRVLGGEYFDELTARSDSKDFEQQLDGVWLGEFSELSTLKRADVERIKQFITNTVDHYRPPYGRSVVDRPRRIVFAATTNAETWLQDTTGGRRFNPVKVESVNLEWLKANRDQLFAEALRDLTAGRKWWIMPVIAREHQAARAVEDPWIARAEDFLCGRKTVQAVDVLRWGLGVEVAHQTHGQLTRVGAVLKKLGCVSQVVWKDGRTQRIQLVPARYHGQKIVIEQDEASPDIGFKDELLA